MEIFRVQLATWRRHGGNGEEAQFESLRENWRVWGLQPCLFPIRLIISLVPFLRRMKLISYCVVERETQNDVYRNESWFTELGTRRLRAETKIHPYYASLPK